MPRITSSVNFLLQTGELGHCAKFQHNWRSKSVAEMVWKLIICSIPPTDLLEAFGGVRIHFWRSYHSFTLDQFLPRIIFHFIEKNYFPNNKSRKSRFFAFFKEKLPLGPCSGSIYQLFPLDNAAKA